MEAPLWVVQAATLMVALLLLRKLTIFHRRNQIYPPGPKPWWIIGNLNVVGSIPHQSFHQLSKKYGDIMQLKFGSRPVVVISSPEMAKEFLKTHGQTFASRPATAAGKYTAYNFSDMLWAPYGPYFHQARRIYLNELFSPKQLDSYEYIRVEERRALMSRLNGLLEKTVVIREHLLRFTSTNMRRMALGDKYIGESESEGSVIKLEELREMLDEWFLLNGAFNIGDWIPSLAFLDLQGYVKRMKSLFKKLDKFHNHVIDDHKARREAEKENFVAKDLVDVLLFVDDPNLKVKLNSDCVKGLLQDILIGGTDAPAIIMEWAMSELLKQPQLLTKATEELDRVIGRERWVEESDIPQLSFIDAIMKETMRLHPPATLLAPHFSIEDCTIAGYQIPKGTILLVNTWSIGRNPRYWKQPEEFRPERFLGRDIDVKGQHFQLLPFGSGHRMCPAYQLGLKFIRSTLANLLHGFYWRLPDDIKLEDVRMDEHYGFTTQRAVPIVAVIKPRLLAHLY